MGIYINLLIILIVIAVFLILFYYVFLREKKKDDVAFDENYYTLENLLTVVRETINQDQIENVAELNLNRHETEKRERQKSLLRKSIRNCCLGDDGEREYTKGYIRDLLVNRLHVNEENINFILPFDNPVHLTAMEKFLILYQEHSKSTFNKAFASMCKLYNWPVERESDDGIVYEITEKDIEKAYSMEVIKLTFVEKMAVISQLIYQKTYGLDATDVLIADMSIDSITGGSGGITKYVYDYLEDAFQTGKLNNNCYDSIWIVFKGKKVKMSFMTFGDNKSLERVVKNISRNDGNALTKLNGYMSIARNNNSRVSVDRPPHSNGWAFFVRNLDSIKVDLDELITDKNNELIKEVLYYLVRGEENLLITGSQGAGKTTFSKSLVKLIDPRYSIRIAESLFELRLNDLYPDRNIHAIQEMGKSLLEAIKYFKKTEADITMIGEVNESALGGALIQIAQSGGVQYMTTSHHDTTPRAIDYFRNALLEHTNLNDVTIAELQVVNAINYDIHCEITKEGHRYVSRITEIVPIESGLEEKENPIEQLVDLIRYHVNRKTYELRDIVVYKDGEYKFNQRISDIGLARLEKHLTNDDYNKLVELMDKQLGVN